MCTEELITDLTTLGRLASGRHRWFQFSKNRGRGRSRAQVIWISFFQDFLS